MTVTEVTVIFFGCLVGYWVVSHFISGNSKSSENGELLREANSELRRPHPGPVVTPWYEILKVSPDASYDEVKTAYQNLIRQYHPDKVASLGDELKELSEKKTKEINVAYREAIAHLGELA
jgi:DnaJ-domain-containing protein 1